jgi:Zn-finger nucleic acid-binding protein
VPALLTFKLIGGNDMQCPNCVNETLVTTQRRDIDIDHCPNCGGVWLDKGELEKILALSDEGRSSSRDWDSESEADEGRSRRRAADNDDDERYEGREHQGEGRYEDDDDDSGSYDDGGRPDSGRGEHYQSREREPYGREEGRGERPSIWREIFENLEKLPLPRV